MFKKIQVGVIYFVLFLLIIFASLLRYKGYLNYEFTWREKWLEYSLFIFAFGLLRAFRTHRVKILGKLAEKKSSNKTRLILAFSLVASIILFIFFAWRSS